MGKKVNKICAIMMAWILLLCVMPCGSVNAASTKVKITNVKSSTLYLTKKQTFTIKTNYNAKKLNYKISNKKIATVNSKGKVTGKKNGDTKITISLKTDASVKCTLPIRVTDSLKVTNASKLKTLNIGKSVTIKTNFKTKDLSFKSSNSKVAKVDKNGKVTAKKAGTSTISIMCNSNAKKMVKLKVTVPAYEVRKGETEKIARIRNDIENTIKKLGVWHYPDSNEYKKYPEFGLSGGMSWFEGRVAIASYWDDINGIVSNYDGCECFYIKYLRKEGNDYVFKCYWG